MASGVWRGTSSPSLRAFLAKSASGVRISSHGAHPRSIQLRRRASSSVSLSLGPKFWRKVSSTGNSSELKDFMTVEGLGQWVLKAEGRHGKWWEEGFKGLGKEKKRGVWMICISVGKRVTV